MIAPTVCETGRDAAVARFGLDAVRVVCAYHASKCLRSHGKSGKFYFPEDETAYFHRRLER
jgi:hypothetical protein